MIDLERRPKLAGMARLRFDKRSDKYMLLYPERGMHLNPTATRIVQLCDGSRPVSDIIACLATEYGKPPELLSGDGAEGA